MLYVWVQFFALSLMSSTKWNMQFINLELQAYQLYMKMKVAKREMKLQLRETCNFLLRNIYAIDLVATGESRPFC